MIQNIAPEITFASFSAILVLSGWIWNSQEKRIVKIESDVEKCPLPDIKKSIIAIETDIAWLKKYLIKN